ncbi:hypothetical protein RB3831 [Rhodopirellula baltica SH 1]|uniref:Uncharacterized protein n=1 Tax=Rhodopirellula baltica (strain DSM 10527 / NCIMB 13988 / SH1) TaxID=243090 RepID=Q7UTK4_RHOBA|nr:hypothetical protein RB3831 [Rhodopirellula baltica SH 1]
MSLRDAVICESQRDLPIVRFYPIIPADLLSRRLIKSPGTR